MATMAHSAGTGIDRYRLPLFSGPDPLLGRGLKIAGGIGLVVLALGLFVPKGHLEDQVEQVPERMAKLILQEPAKPKPVPPKVEQVAKAVIDTPPPAPMPKPEPVTAPRHPDVAARRVAPVVPADRGTEGRERAKEATQQLASATTSIDNVLSGLDQALDAKGDASVTQRPSRRRGTRSGRAASDVATAGALPAGKVTGSGSSALGGARIEIAALGGIERDGGGTPGGTGSGSSKTGVAGGSADGELRSDASLLAVVRKYAPGIRFCYENELKKTPGLGGKLIVAITVAAAGNVTNAVVVTDTIGSHELTSCALAQIDAWRFPAIPAGSVTFRAPFVFTPPES